MIALFALIGALVAVAFLWPVIVVALLGLGVLWAWVSMVVWLGALVGAFVYWVAIR